MPVVDASVLTRRLEQIDSHLAKLTPYIMLSYEDFLNNAVAQDVVEYNLFQCINHIIDIIQHIVLMKIMVFRKMPVMRQRYFLKIRLYPGTIWTF